MRGRGIFPRLEPVASEEEAYARSLLFNRDATATAPRQTRRAPEPTVGQPCGRLSAGNIPRIFGRMFKTPCAEWYTSVDGIRLPTVELKSKAFLAVDSGA
eukprot:1193091-Prorocentrum_minimum.AAC.2